MSEEQKKQLERQLWNIANTLRGKMNADEFRDYILGFIFYKYLSEKMDIYANNILKPDGILFTDIDESKDEGQEYITAIREEALEKLGYFLKPSELFSKVAKRGNYDSEGKPLVKEDESSYGLASNFILEDLQKILNNVQNSTMGTESEEDFDNLFEDMDLNSTKLGKTPEARNVIIAKVLAHLDKIDFKLENTELDVLGDAYEYLIGKFASGAGKKAGEFYTPQEVSIVLAKLVTTGKKKLKSVYDPTCGSGSLLLRVAKEVDEVNNFYGQELNRTTYNLARMNMILHDVHYRKFDIKQEDTLENPQHLEHRFEAIVANPPFSADWSANQLFRSDDRFSQYGKLAPKSKADFAFVQHMVHHLAENGQMAVVLPHGVLFRGGGEAQIRKYLITEKNCLDAVIGLPNNIFYGTSIATCILVFKKCRENPDDILFIDSSSYYNKVKTQHILRKSDVDKIIFTYRNRIVEDKYSHLASLAEIEENRYNLNIPRYIDSFEEEKRVDLELISKKLSTINLKIIEKEKLIIENCTELNIPVPNGINLPYLKTYMKGLVQSLFSQKIRFKQKNGENFKNWKEHKLNEVVSDFKVPMRDKPKDLTGEIPWCRIEDFKGREIVESKSNQGVSKETVSQMNLKIMPEGTLLVSCSADLGRCAIVRKPIVTNQTFIGLVPDTKFLCVEYFYYAMINSARLLNRLSSGTTISYLSRKEFENFKLNLPSYDEQVKISNFLMAIDDKISLIEKK